MQRRIGFRLAGEPPFTGDAGRAVESSWPMFAPLLTRTAERMTDDQDEREDLLQEAMIKLWKTDPTRFDLRDHVDVRYLQKVLVHRMWRVWGGKIRFRTEGSEEWQRLDEWGLRYGEPGEQETGGSDLACGESRGSDGA